MDDEPDFLALVADALQRAGVAFTEGVQSLPEAEEALSAGFRPSVVILDLHVNEQRGESLLEKLRSDPHFSDVKVIACSGDWPALSRIRHSVDRILLKPVGVTGLLRALFEVCTSPAG